MKNKFQTLLTLLIISTLSFASQAQQNLDSKNAIDFNSSASSATEAEIRQHNNSINQNDINSHNNSITQQFRNEVDANIDNDGCDIPSDEELVCEVLMCAIGIAIPESASKCAEVFREYAAYKATLGRFDSPPSCRSRNQNCERGDKISKNEDDQIDECRKQLGNINVGGSDPCLALRNQ